MSSRGPIWLGYGRNGGRVYLDQDSIRPGINLLGQGAGELVALLAYICNEAGLRTLVLDFHGRTTRHVLRYMERWGGGESGRRG